jgi:hypothetical protein
VSDPVRCVQDFYHRLVLALLPMPSKVHRLSSPFLTYHLEGRTLLGFLPGRHLGI